MENLFNYFTTDNISGKKCTVKWLSKNNLELYTSIMKNMQHHDILYKYNYILQIY